MLTRKEISFFALLVIGVKECSWIPAEVDGLRDIKDTMNAVIDLIAFSL